MKKYSLRFQFTDRVFKFTVPGIGNNLNFKQRLLEIATSLRSSIFLLFLSLIPVSMYFYDQVSRVGLESSLLIYLTLGLLVVSSFYIIEVFIVSRERVIDPKGSFAILIFGLLVTASSAFLVFTDYESSENTFGDVSEIAIKGLAGLTIIILMGIYYYISLHRFQYGKGKKLLTSFGIGLIIFGLIGLVDERLSLDLLVYLVGIPILFAAFAVTTGKFLKLLLGAGIGLSIYNIVRFPWFEDAYTIFLTSLVITSLIISYFVFSFGFDHLSNYLSNYRKDLISIFESIRKFKFINSEVFQKVLKILILPSLIILPITILLLALFLIGNGIRTEVFNGVLISYETAFSRINDDLITLITGTGAGLTTVNFPLGASIIIANGILGVIGYLVLYIFAFIESIKLLIKESKTLLQFFVKVCLTTVIIFVPIFSLFAYPSLFVILSWWVVLSLILENKYKNKFIYTPEIESSIKQRRFTKIIKTLSLLTLFIISYILVYTVINNIGILF